MTNKPVRTDDEILARIELRRPQDVLGFEWPYYMLCLPFELARPYLKDPQMDPNRWKQLPRDHATMREECIGYMPFAWEKANNCRGISANRSISHFQCWLWFLGEESWGDQLFDDYEQYGKPQLVRICQFLGLDSAQWDDGRRVNNDD